RVGHESHGFSGEFFIDRLHALLGERAGALDLLRPVWVLSGTDHSTRALFFLQLRVLEVIGMLRLVFRVEMVERAEELTESMHRGQMLVAIAEVVLADLASHVTLSLEQLSDGYVARLQAFVCARQPDFEEAGTEAALTSDEA